MRSSSERERILIDSTLSNYVAGVLSGDIVAGKLVRFACQRHLADIERSKQEDYSFYFDESAARESVLFFGQLQHTTGSYDGEPFMLYPFQQFIVGSLFGWKEKEATNHKGKTVHWRRYRRAFVSLARGNGKSPIGAGATLKWAVMDDPIESRAHCFTVATKRDQARIVFDEIKQYVDRCDWIRDRMQVHQYNISVPSNDSMIRPLSSEGKTADGYNPHCICVDELHAWREEHRELFEKLVTALGKRDQPLLLVITTAGSDESDIWQEQYEVAHAVVDPDNNINDDRLFVYLAEIDDEDDELDEACWPKANPLLEFGVVKIDHLRTMAIHANRNPLKRNEFRRYHCNKLTTSTLKPITAEMWAACAGELPDLRDMYCHAGFDWGWRDDLAALGFVFPLDQVEIDGEVKNRYAIRADVWMPDHGKRDIKSPPFVGFIANGWLTTTMGESTDVQSIYDCFDARFNEYQIQSMAYDHSNCREFSTKVENEYGTEAISFGQSCGRYNEPLREFINAVRERRIVHDGNELLEWCALNMAIRQDSREYIMPSKKRSMDKIDPICSIVMAFGEAMFCEDPHASYYRGGPPVFA